MSNGDDLQVGQCRLYGDLAWTWPIISPPSDYAEEANRFCELLRRFGGEPVTSLLHLGCGGGHLDWTLKQLFEIVGVDLSAEMLRLARGLNTQVAYLQGDLRTVRLRRSFDAVIVADAIDYMLTADDLRSAFFTAFEHLRPGGVFCTYAEITPGSWLQNETDVRIRKSGTTEIVFVENRYDPDASDSTVEDVHVHIMRASGRLRVEADRHVLGIFGLDVWRSLLVEVGFDVRLLERDADGIPWFVCTRPVPPARPAPQQRGGVGL
jgi:cyclopropane fatty-acyl-phospholipid synthase-like methyltransferase